MVVVHIRIAEDGRIGQTGSGSFCWTVSEAPADVLRVAPMAHFAPRFMLTRATILASRNDTPLVAGQPSQWLPRPKDRIRLKRGGPIVILDFGARGEALWKRSPATRHGQLHLSDDPGARADAGAEYVVEDVQFEAAAEQKLHFVWVRLAAAP